VCVFKKGNKYTRRSEVREMYEVREAQPREGIEGRARGKGGDTDKEGDEQKTNKP
jgi:hypothetical protein